MYRSGGGGDVNVPALPVRRSAVGRQSPSTPPRQQTFIQQQQRSTSTARTQLPTSSSPSSSLPNLANLDNRADSSRSRVMNDYRDFPTTAATLTTTTTTPAVEPGDSHSVSRASPDTDQTSPAPPPPPRDVRLSWKKDGDKDDHRTKKEKSKTASSKAVSECRESIVCQRCGRCRCRECTRHRPATGRRAVEICSCVSCVRRVVAARRRRQRYDWNDDDDDDDELCVCSPCRAGCCRRWTLLVLLSVCLPCLCFYWPLRCVVATCSRCTGRQVRGCRCVERYTSQLVRTSPPTESIVIDRVTST